MCDVTGFWIVKHCKCKYHYKPVALKRAILQDGLQVEMVSGLVQTSTASHNAVFSSLPDDYYPTEGSYFAELIAKTTLKQTGLSWNAGDTVNFDWAFLAFDALPYNDRGVFRIIDTANAVNTPFTLAKVQTVGAFQDTGWQSFSHTFDTAGSGNLVFRSINVPDDGFLDFSSSLLIDNVDITPVSRTYNHCPPQHRLSRTCRWSSQKRRD